MQQGDSGAGSPHKHCSWQQHVALRRRQPQARQARGCQLGGEPDAVASECARETRAEQHL